MMAAAFQMQLSHMDGTRTALVPTLTGSALALLEPGGWFIGLQLVLPVLSDKQAVCSFGPGQHLWFAQTIAIAYATRASISGHFDTVPPTTFQQRCAALGEQQALREVMTYLGAEPETIARYVKTRVLKETYEELLARVMPHSQSEIL